MSSPWRAAFFALVINPAETEQESKLSVFYQ
jgi:hypothetical protein